MAKSPSLDVNYIAQLARLNLSEPEKKRFAEQLADVLSHVNKLGELNLDRVEPTFQTTGLADVLREDQVDRERILSADEALANSADHDHKRGLFRVPKVLR